VLYTSSDQPFSICFSSVGAEFIAYSMELDEGFITTSLLATPQD
jgi:hypothetical protein